MPKKKVTGLWGLTAREWQALRLLCDKEGAGDTTRRRLAAGLNLAPQTVASMLSRIARGQGCGSTLELFVKIVWDTEARAICFPGLTDDRI